MGKYRFEGLTDKLRLVETMVDQSKMDAGEALFIVDHHLERCVEVWEGDMLCWYCLILVKDGVRSFHGYSMVKGRARHALRVAQMFLKNEPRILSCHREANQKVNRLLKLMGFKDCVSIDGFKVLGRVL